MQTWWVDSSPLSRMIQSDKRRMRRRNISTHISKYWICRVNVFSTHTLMVEASCCPPDFVLPLQQWTTSNTWIHIHTLLKSGEGHRYEKHKHDLIVMICGTLVWWKHRAGYMCVWIEMHTQTHTQMTFHNVNKHWWKDSCCCIDRVWMALDAGA